MKIAGPGGPSSSTVTTTVADSNIVEPIDEGIVMDDIVFTEQDVRKAKAKFYELMALHREILAMKFADKSYNKILEEKIKRRDHILGHLQTTVIHWRLLYDNSPTSLSSEEFEVVERAGHSLVSLGTSLLSRRQINEEGGFAQV